MDFLIATTTPTSTLYTLADPAKDLLNFFAQFGLALAGIIIFELIVLIVILIWQ